MNWRIDEDGKHIHIVNIGEFGGYHHEAHQGDRMKPIYCGCGVCHHCEYGVPIGWEMTDG